MLQKTVFFLMLSFGLQGQNTELDDRNGFKTIKFGTLMDEFKGLKDISDSENSPVIKTIYTTNDSNLGYLFNDKIDFFELSFMRQSKKLAYIRAVVIVKLPYTDTSVIDKFDSLREKFTSVLGKHNDVLKKHIVGLAWYGDKVAMTLTMDAEKIDFDDRGLPVGLTSFNVTFYSSEFREEKSNSRVFSQKNQ